MLNSLYIKNFRNLKELKINSLGRINLLVGKNNTGKSSVLEAVGLYATRGDFTFINQILGFRGQNFKKSIPTTNLSESDILLLSSLFSDWKISYDKNDEMIIGEIDDVLLDLDVSQNKMMSLRFAKYLSPIGDDASITSLLQRRILAVNGNNSLDNDVKIGIELKIGPLSSLVGIDANYANTPLSNFDAITKYEKSIFIRTSDIEGVSNSQLWDKIIFSPMEQNVIDALKIIEPNVQRLAFVEDVKAQRAASVKLENKNKPVPLRSMGDGINRILTIILALVNADGGYLLIDEFENGLHHTVQTKLWEIIFKMAEKLNVQVFATTHSNDCIRSFETVLNSDGNNIDGKLIRLENVNGEIKQVEIEKESLKILEENDIEIR